MRKAIKKVFWDSYYWVFNQAVLSVCAAWVLQSFHDVISWSYIRQPFKSLEHYNCTDSAISDANVIDLVSVSFNNEFVIKAQIELLKKHLADPYYFTVVDNSSDAEKRGMIRTICQAEHVGYISLPANPFSGHFGNWSHGLALNWVFKNFIAPRGADNFGFLDHDLFPIKSTSLVEFLKRYRLGGVMHQNGKYWYLWPGCCFYRREVFMGKKVNFSSRYVRDGLKVAALDTGGGNWAGLYSLTDKSSCYTFTHQLAFLNEKNPDGPLFEHLGSLKDVEKRFDTGKLGTSPRLVEFFGDWLHIRRMGYAGSEELAAKSRKVLSLYLSGSE